MKNRLDLNWALTSAKERSLFLQHYMEDEPSFQKRPPTPEELETMANYLLWGQDEDGLNPDQRKEIQMPRRNSSWTSKEIESLDALLESPTFQENSLYQLGTSISKKTREVFSREKILPENRPLFTDLWNQIDSTELLINFYELAHGKRKNPPRPELLSRFAPDHAASLEEKAKTLSQFHYLKMRHLLVELRRQQYTIKDAVQPRILTYAAPSSPITSQLEDSSEEISIFPFGPTEQFLFRNFQDLIPKNFSEQELKEISSAYWRKREERNHITNFFDFSDLETVYQLFLALETLQEEPTDFSSSILPILWYYVRQANLTSVQQKILELKIQKVKNQDIAAQVNKEFDKNYTTNYISTIFRKKIIPEINSAAIYHEKIVGSLFFEEDFKVCAKCGRTLLRDPINFVRRSRASDGLSNHCKRCDKEEREKKKGGIIKLNGN